MAQISMTLEQVSLFSSHYVGDRDGIFFDGEELHVSDAVEASVRQAIADIEIDSGLTVLKAAKIAGLTDKCRVAIIAGYASNALGSKHIYPSGITDQINMMGSVTASLFPGLPAAWQTPFWCQDQEGEWSFRMHNAEAIQQAGSDGKAHVVTCQSLLDQLVADVTSAATVEAVDAVAWP